MARACLLAFSRDFAFCAAVDRPGIVSLQINMTCDHCRCFRTYRQGCKGNPPRHLASGSLIVTAISVKLLTRER